VNNRRVLSLFLSVALCVVALAALLVLAGDPARAQASTRYVATTGTDSGGCTDPNSPCRTVQYAVDAADDEDLIKVATGIYTDVHLRSGIIQTVFITKTVAIQGGYAVPGFIDPPDPETNPTTLDAAGQGRVLYVVGNISPTIEGLRITGGKASGLRGDPYLRDAGGGV
jgi:hypothetical protein